MDLFQKTNDAASHAAVLAKLEALVPPATLEYPITDATDDQAKKYVEQNPGVSTEEVR